MPRAGGAAAAGGVGRWVVGQSRLLGRMWGLAYGMLRRTPPSSIARRVWGGSGSRAQAQVFSHRGRGSGLGVWGRRPGIIACLVQRCAVCAAPCGCLGRNLDARSLPWLDCTHWSRTHAVRRPGSASMRIAALFPTRAGQSSVPPVGALPCRRRVASLCLVVTACLLNGKQLGVLRCSAWGATETNRETAAAFQATT